MLSRWKLCRQSPLANKILMMKGELTNYRMDRSVVTAASFEEADDHTGFWQDKTPEERLNAACFIINNIYNVTPQTKVDRTVVGSRKHSG